jgi:hypothetical protein
MMRQPEHRHRPQILVQAVIVSVAATLLFWNLTEKYLWQDEAATAVLAVRMLRFGRPLAYDGVNLITIDMKDEEGEDAAGRTAGPRASVDYFAHRGDFKPDTTWVWQPWGLFAIAAVGIELLGQTTLGARLPFVLAGFATVPLLYRLVRKQFGSFEAAALAAVMLVTNSYWLLHARQCRYYSVSSFFLVLTLMAYARWQWGGRSAAAFIVAAWCWFQVDYGTVLPVLAVLFLEALTFGRSRWRTIAAGAILGATLVPFVIFYDLLHRGSTADGTWLERFQLNFFNTNEYVVPALVVLAVVFWLVRDWKSVPEGKRRLVVACCGVIVALMLWIPTVTVSSFLRYVIIAAPVGAMLTGWLLARLPQPYPWCAAAVLICTPWVGLPLRRIAQPPDWWEGSIWYRVELKDVRDEIFSHQPDPNRLVIDWLRKNAKPTDEILINYEDFPLMYYLPNPIRGGIATFRAEDDAKTPPRFVILRYSVDFVQWPVYQRELARYHWEPVPVKAPDVMWGNNPDPIGDDDPRKAADLYFARRVDGP